MRRRTCRHENTEGRSPTGAEPSSSELPAELAGQTSRAGLLSVQGVGLRAGSVGKRCWKRMKDKTQPSDLNPLPERAFGGHSNTDNGYCTLPAACSVHRPQKQHSFLKETLNQTLDLDCKFSSNFAAVKKSPCTLSLRCSGAEGL